MARSLPEALDRVERKPLKCALRGTSETFVRGGELFERARIASGFSKEEAADHYGVSPSLLTRQTTNQDNQHLSFQRICEMPIRFRRQLVEAMVKDLQREGVKVRQRTVFEFEDESEVA